MKEHFNNFIIEEETTMMENENMMTEIIEEVSETGMQEVTKSTSGTNMGFAMLVGSAITLAAIGIGKGVKKGIDALRAKKKAKTITRTIGDDKDDDITKDNLDIDDIEP
jgi:F0F1-type ATP synthase membrane subunit c/vacuolar-type H+-ATPase subunit K